MKKSNDRCQESSNYSIMKSSNIYSEKRVSDIMKKRDMNDEKERQVERVISNGRRWTIACALSGPFIGWTEGGLA